MLYKNEKQPISINFYIMMKNFNTIISLTILSVLTTACSSTPEITNPIMSHSESTKRLGQTWDEGNQLVTDGKKLIKKGNKQIEDGENNLAKGTEMLDKGEAMIESSESEFDKLLQVKPSAEQQLQAVE